MESVAIAQPRPHWRRANGEPGFHILAKVAVYAEVAIASAAGASVPETMPLSAALIGYLALGGRGRMALWAAIWYLALSALYALHYLAGIEIPVFSPTRILQGMFAFPTLVAFLAIVTAPPGVISAALARLRMPKKAVVGALVILRFFPTLGSFLARLRDSLRKRGLTGPGQMARNPVDTLEYLLVPIMMSLASTADQLASSAIARAAEAPGARTSYYSQPIRVHDIACIALFAAIDVALAVM